MESLVVVSKVKNFIKKNHELSTSSTFCEKLSLKLQDYFLAASLEAKSSKRKTVLDRDILVETPQEPEQDEVLVVSSKVKRFIKEKQGLSTSVKVMNKASSIVRLVCNSASLKAKEDGRKTVLERDLE